MKYFRIGVEIKSEQGAVSRVGGAMFSPSGTLAVPNGILTYPDRMVSNFVIYATNDSPTAPSTVWSYLKYEAKNSQASNNSYKLLHDSPDNSAPYDFTDSHFSGAATITTADLLKQNSKYNRDANRVYVSEAYKPQSVLGRNAHYIGNSAYDAVMAFASNTQDISSGQFGQYPLYAFCKDSITAMEVGSGDVAFSRVSPVRIGESLVGYEAITNFNDAILFVSKRGAELLTEGVLSVNIQDSVTDDMDFLKNVTAQAALGVFSNAATGRKELWISTNGITYCYSFTYKRWFTISGSFEKLFRIFDGTYSLSGGKIYKEDSGAALAGMFRMAPVHFGEFNVVKRFRRVIAHFKGLVRSVYSNYTNYEFQFASNQVATGFDHLEVEYEYRYGHRERVRRDVVRTTRKFPKIMDKN